MNNKQELINVYQELIKTLSVDQLKEFYEVTDGLEAYEKILLSMPKKAEMETFRVALITTLLNWIDFDSLNEEELTELISYLTTKKEN